MAAGVMSSEQLLQDNDDADMANAVLHIDRPVGWRRVRGGAFDPLDLFERVRVLRGFGTPRASQRGCMNGILQVIFTKIA